MTNMEKILKEIDNIEQLGADMRYKINNGNLDLEIELESINEWVKSLKRRIKKKRRVNNYEYKRLLWN